MNLKGKSVQDIAAGYAGKRAFKVSAGSETKKVAGAIAHCVRIGGVPPALIAKGERAVNNAVKAIAVARTYLSEEEEVDLIAQPQFKGKSSGCVIHVRRAGPMEIEMETEPLKVTNKVNPYKLAGAIAGKIREKERVNLSAIGPKGVFHALEALAVARTYLHDDSIDLKFTPQFTSYTVAGRESSGIYFACLSRKVT